MNLIGIIAYKTNIHQKWQVYIDPYTKLTRLDLFQFDGTPMNPMFLAYRPPQMLPTVTMNPTATPTAAKAKRSAGSEPRGEQLAVPLNANAKHIKRSLDGSDLQRPSLIHRIDASMVWWAGVGMIIFGGTAYML
jgi:hypothetical protein